MSRWLRVLCAALAFAGVAAHATNVVDELRALPAPAERMKEVDASTRAAFDTALADYDRQAEQNPYDIVDQLQRCRFIEQFIANYEYAGFIQEIVEQSEQCRRALLEEHPDHPEIKLWQLESVYGEELLQQGAELQRQSASGMWTVGQSARLYTTLARAADLADKRELALKYALRALELDETSDVRLIAAANLIKTGEKSQALEILTATVREVAPRDGWVLSKRLDLLTQLGAHEEALELHAQLKELPDYDHTAVARLLRTLGANDLARQELTLATQNDGPYGTGDERELFRFELELGSAEQALVAYNAWRDAGWLEDPLGINRFALFVRDPLLPWQARDFIGLLGFLGALGAIALVCMLPIAGVHYRGLAVRAHSGAPYPNEGWRLRHAWTALVCFGAASLIALYSAGAIDVTTTSDVAVGIDGSDTQLARITLIESLLTIALLLPLGAMAASKQGSWLGTQWTVAKSCLVGLALAVVFRLPLLLQWLRQPDALEQVLHEDAIWQMIGAVRDQYGLITALWVVAIVAPVVEELIFRGILYRAFAAHIHPIWANIVQAALFSAMHMNVKGAPLLFVFGLVLGSLTRRSGGLLAAMVMHAAFNLIVALMML